MTSLALNDNNDIYFTNYQLTFTKSKQQEILQRVKIRLRFFEGEWFLNTIHGVPYYQNIIGTKPINLNIINNIFINEILDVEGVLSIQESKLDYDNEKRKLIFEFIAITENGTIEESIEI
jgi:hypothetical protein